MLEVSNIEVLYAGSIRVLKGVSLKVPDNGIIGLLGSNGAGKSTTLKAISGLLKTEDGEVSDGRIYFDGTAIQNGDPSHIARLGIIQVIERRPQFTHLSIEENLRVGGHLSDRETLKSNLDMVYKYFPRLKERRNSEAGYLSGGEQQMLTIGRTLMARPKLILLDEPSLGLAPRFVHETFEIITKLNKDEKKSILLVEQNAKAALSIVDHAYVIEDGKIVMDASAKEMKDNEDIKEFYLGFSKTGARKRFRDIKHYKRRKRWL